jgi:phage gp46-like protein
VNLIRHVAVGTAAWAVALAVLVALHTQLAAQGRGWWIGTAAAGVAIGLAGLVYLRATGGRGPR